MAEVNIIDKILTLWPYNADIERDFANGDSDLSVT